MIVFISDLHIGTHDSPNRFHLPAGAFEGFFRDLAGHARRAHATEVTLVLLGDIFEMTHTEAWHQDEFRRPRPWQVLEPSEPDALEVLKRIITDNDPIFKLFRGGIKLQDYVARSEAPADDRAAGPATTDREEWDPEVKVVYVPGNHDRLCNVYPALRAAVDEALGLKRDDPRERFDWDLWDDDHHVYAHHGHTYDRENYAGGPEHTHEDHCRVPSGDVETAMFAARVPKQVERALYELGEDLCPKHDREQITENLAGIYDIRPLSAFRPWLLRQVKTVTGNGRVMKVVEDAVDATARECRRLPIFGQIFWGRWLEGIRWRIQREILAAVPLFELGRRREVVDWLYTALRGDPDRALLKGAMLELDRLDEDEECRYVVFGHTHNPMQRVMTVTDPQNGDHRRAIYYANTGTWRVHYDEAESRKDFAAAKSMTYTMIYSDKENRSRGGEQSLEVWTGMLRDDDVSPP